MGRNEPVIGITPSFDYNENKMYINNIYCEAIILSGGMPVLLPVTEDEGLLSQMVEEFDGFLLSEDRMWMLCIGESGITVITEKFLPTVTRWSFL